MAKVSTLDDSDLAPIYISNQVDVRSVTMRNLSNYLEYPSPEPETKYLIGGSGNDFSTSSIEIISNKQFIWELIISVEGAIEIIFPEISNCVDKQEILITTQYSSNSSITFQGNGADVIHPPTIIQSFAPIKFRFDETNKSWYVVSNPVQVTPPQPFEITLDFAEVGGIQYVDNFEFPSGSIDVAFSSVNYQAPELDSGILAAAAGIPAFPAYIKRAIALVDNPAFSVPVLVATSGGFLPSPFYASNIRIASVGAMVIYISGSVNLLANGNISVGIAKRNLELPDSASYESLIWVDGVVGSPVVIDAITHRPITLNFPLNIYLPDGALGVITTPGGYIG